MIRADLFDGPLQQTHVRRDVFGDEGADVVRQLEAERDGFVTTRITAQEIWGLCVKVFSNVVVVVLNYVFSKLIIFKKK